MTDHQQDSAPLSEEEQDQSADMKAALIVFVTMVVMAVHFISGFTLDF